MIISATFLLLSLSELQATNTFRCPTEEGYEHDATSGLCVILLPDWKTYTEGKRMCKDRGDRLVWLTTTAKHNFFKNIIDEDFWLGGYLTNSGEWVWSENASLCQTQWSPEQPDGSGKCMGVGVWSGFDWDDVPCYTDLRVGCERVLENQTTIICSQQMTKTNTAVIDSPVVVHQQDSWQLNMVTEVDPGISLLPSSWVPNSPVQEGTVNTSRMDYHVFLTIGEVTSASSFPPIGQPLVSELTHGMTESTTGSTGSVSDIFPNLTPLLISDVTRMSSLQNVTPISMTYQTPTSTQYEPFIIASTVDGVFLETATDGDVIPQSQAPSLTTSSTTWFLSTAAHIDTQCPCFCGSNIPLYNFSSLDLTKRLAEFREQLLLDKRKLSRRLAKYTSAPDGRRSSLTIGSAGILIIVVFPCLFLVGDLEYVVRLLYNRREKTMN